MTLRILLIAAAALICHCAADVAHINHAAPNDVLVPFNDLLPPPLDETTPAPAAPPTKPSKKSTFQQQQKPEQLQARSKVSEISAEKQPELQLALDLLPPFAEPVQSDSTTTTTTTTRSPISTTRSPSTTPTSSPITSTTTTTTQRPPVSRVTAATSLPRVASLLQQQQARVLGRANSAPSEYSAASRFSADLIRHYATHFQFTTPRPPRGPLPTLTPFPRFIKK